MGKPSRGANLTLMGAPVESSLLAFGFAGRDEFGIAWRAWFDESFGIFIAQQAPKRWASPDDAAFVFGYDLCVIREVVSRHQRDEFTRAPRRLEVGVDIERRDPITNRVHDVIPGNAGRRIRPFANGVFGIERRLSGTETVPQVFFCPLFNCFTTPTGNFAPTLRSRFAAGTQFAPPGFGRFLLPPTGLRLQLAGTRPRSRGRRVSHSTGGRTSRLTSAAACDENCDGNRHAEPHQKSQ